MKYKIHSKINIYETKDYDGFKIISSNRDIKKSNVNNIIKSIDKSIGIYNPIVVNKSLEVLDGQHRLEACKKLEIPVKYIIIDNNNGNNFIKTINSASMNWGLADYIKFNAKELNIHTYVKICDISEREGQDVQILAYLLGLTTSSVKKGVDKDTSKLVLHSRYFNRLWSKTKNNTGAKRGLALAILKLSKNKNFNFGILFQQIDKYFLSLIGDQMLVNQIAIYDAFIKVYNYRQRKNRL